jgi:hypothetical protein
MSRIDDIASLALGLNGHYADRWGVFGALEIVQQALEGSQSYKALLGVTKPEDIAALEIVKARFVLLVGEEEWLEWWEGKEDAA